MGCVDRFLPGLIVLLAVVSKTNSRCVWYGQCSHQLFKPDHKLNCLYDGQARPFRTEKALKVFARDCPKLYRDAKSATCCSDSQMLTLDKQLQIPWKSLQGNPDCARKYFDIWCNLTCSPNMAGFVSVNSTTLVKLPDGTQTKAITGVNYALPQQVVEDLYDSCKDVMDPRYNVPALSVLCGRAPADCTGKAWLVFSGTTWNGEAPFDVFFTFTD